MAKNTSELHTIKDTLNWVVAQGNAAHILPEQMDPFTGEALSVAPLTWSHATFVDTVNRYISKYEEIKNSR